MRIEVVKTMEAFGNLKEDWEAVYAVDPNAQFFLSWTWLSGWLKRTPKWFVLVARLDASSPPVAFFPIRLRVERTPTGGIVKEVAMAGNRAADYTGFICRPECDDKVIPAFAAYIKKIKWDHLQLENLRLSSARIRRFLHLFSEESFQHKMIKVVNKEGNVDNYICPYVSLPDTWDCYLSENLKANTRHNARRYLRRVESSANFSIAHANQYTADRDIDILLYFLALKWGRKKGRYSEGVQRSLRTLLRHCLSIQGACSFLCCGMGITPWVRWQAFLM